MNKEFKVGDKVCSAMFGNGVVKKVNSCDTYPIVVEFDGLHRVFTLEGKNYHYDKHISLFHGHGTFQFIPDPELEMLRKE